MIDPLGWVTHSVLHNSLHTRMYNFRGWVAEHMQLGCLDDNIHECCSWWQVDSEKERFTVTLKQSLVGASDAAYLQSLLQDLEFAEKLRY